MPTFLRRVTLLCLAFYSTILIAHSEEYRISLLTCDPGDELYSAFGHSAIRVIEISSGQDLVFNYGTFDFNTPFFYVKFTQRTLDYMLSVSSFDRFLVEYQYYQRGIREQVLDLNPEQTQRLVDFLTENYKPENRFYRYDFFYDNCATRIRDVFEEILGRQLDWNEDLLAEEKTFRNLIDEYVYPLPWADFGIDLALGAVIDVAATEREKQFLPDYMEAAFGRAMIVGDGPTRQLVKETYTILEFPDRPADWSLFNPYLLFWLFLILVGVLTFIGYRRKRLFLGFDISLFTILGLLGILITLLWFFTFHSQTKSNWNILWAFPGYLVLAIGLYLDRTKTWIRKYLLFALVFCNLALVVWVIGIQSFHPSIVPILLVILLRTNFLYYNLDRFGTTKKMM